MKTKTKIIAILLVMPLLLTACKDSKKAAAGKAEGYYTCSMHTQVIKQEPGKCPICGMRLTFVATGKKKKKQDHSKMSMADGSGKHEGMEGMGDGEEDNQPKNFQFSLADNLLENSKLITSPAKKEVFSRVANYSAHIDYNEDPDRLVIITTKYDGWVERLYVSKEGQYLGRGKTLMGIYSPKILAAKEEYVTTYNAIKEIYKDQPEAIKKDLTVQAARRKLQYLDISSSQISKLERTGKAGRLSYYNSPIGGVLVEKKILQGEFIKAGQELLRIANLSRLWVFIHVFEKDLPFIKKGQKVLLKSAAYPDKKFKGRIDLIYPFLNPQTRDVKVRIVLGNTKNILKPGMFADVEIKSVLPGKQIIIPDTAITYSGDKSYTFVSLGDGEFELRPLIVKITSDGRAVIAKGLEENELVVINGQFLLDSEASLKEAISKGGMVGHNH